MNNVNTIKSEDSPEYIAPVTTDEDAIIQQAIEILNRRVLSGQIMSKPSDVKNYLITTASDMIVENFRVMWLDGKHQLISVETLSTGTINQASVYPREVVKAGIRNNAVACIITHNHPSGNTEPSRSDIALTNNLKKALDLVDIRLLDHIITAGGKAVSLAEMGQI